jgi:hypothetical protein
MWITAAATVVLALLFIDGQGRPIAVIEVEKRALNVGGRPD